MKALFMKRQSVETIFSMAKVNNDKINSPQGCTFHRIGLGNENIVTENNWTLRTLGTTMKDLHHENVSMKKSKACGCQRWAVMCLKENKKSK